MKAVSGVEAYLGGVDEWSLLCARPVEHRGDLKLGLSLQVEWATETSSMPGWVWGGYVARAPYVAQLPSSRSLL